MRLAKKTPRTRGVDGGGILLCFAAQLLSRLHKVICRQPRRWLVHTNWAAGGITDLICICKVEEELILAEI